MPETLRAAFIIGRRDFLATVMSRAFLFFLLGPMFPVAMGFLFGSLGNRMAQESAPAAVAVVMAPDEAARIAEARQYLMPLLAGGERPPMALLIEKPDPSLDAEARRTRALARTDAKVLGVLDGTLTAPRFTGAVDADGRTVRIMTMLVAEARRPAAASAPSDRPLEIKLVEQSSGTIAQGRELTARAGQGLLFILTLLLSGMLLSQLIEEKSNKVIEVLASAVPIDSIFIGKLGAMLAMSLLGILVWGAAGLAAIQAWLPGGFAMLPVPAIGWPLFLLLTLVYFMLAYLVLGAAFLGIGAQASTVREVQTISMPVTMSQMLVFALATAAVGRPDSREGIIAAVVPFSSPFAMLSRAAEQPMLWTHLLAIAWQLLWAALIIRLASGLFKRTVMKSGGASGPWWKRRRPA